MRIKTAFLVLLVVTAPGRADAEALRVCSEPNNLPFSNRAGEGFENKIAELLARDLGETLDYVYALQNERFVKHTLDTGKCDVIMGMPAGIDDVITTRPYYASSYVFVSRRRDNIPVSSLSDAKLRSLKIGVHLIGDESTPPTVALGRQGIVDNVRGYLIYGDFGKPNPPARLIEAVEKGDVDIAAVWGPLAGFFAKQSSVPLRITRFSDTDQFKPVAFRFAIAVGVHKGNTALRDRLDAVLAKEQPRIQAILRSYGVPLVDLKEISDE